MKTKTINIYSFNELSEEAKQKAIERFYDINVNYNWWELTYEDAENIGLKINSFELERNRHAKGEFLDSACKVAANILTDHYETCETYKTAENFLKEWQPIFDEYMNEESEHYESSESEEQLQELESNFLESLLEDYSIMLQNECEYLTSEEAIIEAIEGNKYEFTEDGTIY
jgi:hypothetical protein